MSIFGNAGGTATQTQQPTSLFGNPAAAQPQSTGLFGSSATGANPQPSSLFGAPAQGQQQGSSLFGHVGGTQQPAAAGAAGAAGSSLFPNQNKTATSVAAQPTYGPPYDLSSSHHPQQTAGRASLFGGPFAASTASTTTMQPAREQDASAAMMDSRRIWNEEDGPPRSRTVIEQLHMVQKKWDPSHSQHAFQAYLYNQVDPSAQPFYRPGPGESEEAWEDALRKAPSAGSIPFRVRGFYELGMRIISQQRHLEILSGRLHEINDGLTTLLRRHELDITSRAAAARRRHAALSQRVLALATKTMIARNRGYALETAEEDLRKKLVHLEREVMDPALAGREEEIWARMVSVREKGKLLETELARAGIHTDEDGKVQEISEETMKQAKKILEDYDSQLNHLTKELEQIKKDWTAWEESKKATNGLGRR